MLPELATLLREQRERTMTFEREHATICPHVFHAAGKPVRRFRKAWVAACRAAGVPGRLFHDLRRTAIRNFERAGVPRSWAMKLSGRRSELVYGRYAIVNEADLGEAVARLAATQSQNRYRTATERQRQGPQPIAGVGARRAAPRTLGARRPRGKRSGA